MASRETKPEVGCLALMVFLGAGVMVGMAALESGHGPQLVGTVGFIVLLVIGFKFMQARARAQDLETAGRRYRNALESIRGNPSDPDARQRALSLGREYLRRRNGGQELSLLQETQIMNEINVACQHARVEKDGSLRVKVTNAAALSGGQLSEEIKKLGDLFMNGYLTAEEFERGKAGLLGAPEDKAAAAVELLQNLSHLKAQGVLSESEFNMKKWEILSERLLPGRGKAASMPHSPPQG